MSAEEYLSDIMHMIRSYLMIKYEVISYDVKRQEARYDMIY